MPLLGDTHSEDIHASALTDFTVPDGPALLQHIATLARTLTGAAWVGVGRRLLDPGRLEVVAGAGDGAPAVGTRLDAGNAAHPHRVIVPLVLGGSPLGALVADGVGRPLPAEAQREVALLAATGALALHNEALIRSLERQRGDAARQHYELLAGTIYHLKNTLANSSDYLALLMLEASLSDVQGEYVARSRRSVDTALRLLTELHDLGMADAGALVPQRDPVSLGPLIRDVMHEHRLSCGTAPAVSFALELPSLEPIRTDADCVRQILDTLLSNAIRYSPEGGVVTLRVRLVSGRRSGDPARWVRLDVSDTGPGVAEQDSVFDEIKRVGRKGTPGFRLAIARRMARLLGGDIILDTASGSGSTFSLWLPAE